MSLERMRRDVDWQKLKERVGPVTPAPMIRTSYYSTDPFRGTPAAGAC